MHFRVPRLFYTRNALPSDGDSTGSFIFGIRLDSQIGVSAEAHQDGQHRMKAGHTNSTEFHSPVSKLLEMRFRVEATPNTPVVPYARNTLKLKTRCNENALR